MRHALIVALAFAWTGAASAAEPHPHGAHHDHGKAFGRAADPKKAKRTVRVEMTDNMRFTPAEIRVKRGEIVRFVATNKGKVVHEMMFGSMAELKKHAEEMRQHPHKAHEEADDDHVAPGKSGEQAWQFIRPGEVYYACLIPGHFEAGMVGKVIVEP